MGTAAGDVCTVCYDCTSVLSDELEKEMGAVCRKFSPVISCDFGLLVLHLDSDIFTLAMLIKKEPTV